MLNAYDDLYESVFDVYPRLCDLGANPTEPIYPTPSPTQEASSEESEEEEGKNSLMGYHTVLIITKTKQN